MSDLENDPSLASTDPLPGFRWPIAVRHLIPASASTLWEAISYPGNLEKCHPFCASNSVRNWPGENSLDEIHYLNGWVLKRSFRNWFEGEGYDLEIGEAGSRIAFVSWRIIPNTKDSSFLRIAVYPHALQQLPVTIRFVPHLLWVRPLLRKYLLSVLRGFEWYISRGEPVPRNQFGRHRWFS